MPFLRGRSHDGGDLQAGHERSRHRRNRVVHPDHLLTDQVGDLGDGQAL
jgi:hypothetical protein